MKVETARQFLVKLSSEKFYEYPCTRSRVEIRRQVDRYNWSCMRSFYALRTQDEQFNSFIEGLDNSCSHIVMPSILYTSTCLLSTSMTKHDEALAKTKNKQKTKEGNW
jgi:hypothetical protein